MNKKNALVLFMSIFALASCDNNLDNSDNNYSNIATKSVSSCNDSKFMTEGIPDYSFDSQNFTPYSTGSTIDYYQAEIYFDTDEIVYNVVPALHGFYPYTNGDTSYGEPNDAEFRGERFEYDVVYVRDNVLCLKFTHIPSYTPPGDLLIYTVAKCGKNVVDRYIKISFGNGAISF